MRCQSVSNLSILPVIFAMYLDCMNCCFNNFLKLKKFVTIWGDRSELFGHQIDFGINVDPQVGVHHPPWVSMFSVKEISDYNVTMYIYKIRIHVNSGKGQSNGDIQHGFIKSFTMVMLIYRIAVILSQVVCFLKRFTVSSSCDQYFSMYVCTFIDHKASL